MLITLCCFLLIFAVFETIAFKASNCWNFKIVLFKDLKCFKNLSCVCFNHDLQFHY